MSNGIGLSETYFGKKPFPNFLSKKRFRISVPVSCLTETTGRRVKARAAILARVGPGHDSYDERTPATRWIRRG